MKHPENIWVNILNKQHRLFKKGLEVLLGKAVTFYMQNSSTYFDHNQIDIENKIYLQTQRRLMHF